MKKLLDLLREMEENETTQIDEVKIDMVDEIGKFFVVEKPKSKGDTTEDLVFESTLAYFANQIRGGLNEKDIIGFYIKRGDANKAAKEAIKAYESNLKEMEDAMNDFREAKQVINDKKAAAKEKIMKLK
jgi:uncharacterized protein YcbK (DUF882 family)